MGSLTQVVHLIQQLMILSFITFVINHQSTQYSRSESIQDINHHHRNPHSYKDNNEPDIITPSANENANDNDEFSKITPSTNKNDDESGIIISSANANDKDDDKEPGIISITSSHLTPAASNVRKMARTTNEHDESGIIISSANANDKDDDKEAGITSITPSHPTPAASNVRPNINDASNEHNEVASITNITHHIHHNENKNVPQNTNIPCIRNIPTINVQHIHNTNVPSSTNIPTINVPPQTINKPPQTNEPYITNVPAGSDDTISPRNDRTRITIESNPRGMEFTANANNTMIDFEDGILQSDDKHGATYETHHARHPPSNDAESNKSSASANNKMAGDENELRLDLPLTHLFSNQNQI